MLSEQSQAKIDREIAKYPSEQKQAAVMAALTVAQSEHGWLSRESMEFVARTLDIPPIRVAEVATFYSMYDLEPVGKHKISVCTNVSCMLRNCDQIVRHLEKKLDIKLGGTTADGKITLKEVECLAACGGAPMMQVDDVYCENLTPARIDEILAGLK